MMARAGQRGRWNKKAPVGTILLLTCMFIPTLTLLQTSEEVTCEPGEYPNDEGICCNKCSPGFKLEHMCQGVNQRSKCTQCSEGQFTDEMNYMRNCRRCRKCKAKYDEEISPCRYNQNRICRCVEGYYKSVIDSETYDCLKCTPCGPDEKEKQTCTPERNFVCECKENYYKVNNKCERCKNCTKGCEHRCSFPALTTRGHEPGHEYLINIITAVGVVAVVSLVLVVLITHVATKMSTKKKMLNPSCQPSDVSQDSCEQVLIQSDEPSENINVKAVPPSPVSEPEPPNLPDCVPLEIRVSDLIYTVLDLVPVLQVKQLVRSLGVKDTEIEQAELDHSRSCREAHYQMLRVWAERGSTGRGRQGRMLHMPLLQELLDELRKMHLGRAAEELETEYGIQ